MHADGRVGDVEPGGLPGEDEEALTGGVEFLVDVTDEGPELLLVVTVDEEYGLFPRCSDEREQRLAAVVFERE